jgi:hypothetical protein
MAHDKHCLALLQERLPDSQLVSELDAELAGRAGAHPPVAGI